MLEPLLKSVAAIDKIEPISHILRCWGLWVHTQGVGGTSALLMAYQARGVMATSNDVSLPTLEKVDRLIAQMPATYTHNKRALQLRYQYGWIVEDCYKRMNIGVSKFRILLAGGEGFIDGRLTDNEKNIDKWCTTN